MVALLGQPRQRLRAEHVDAAADPVRQAGLLPEAEHGVVLVDVDDPEVRLERDDGDRRRRVRRPVMRGQRAQIEIDELVAVERVHVARVLAGRGREAQAAAAPERLRLLDRDDLGAEPGQVGREHLSLSRRAAHDHALHARAHEQGDLVREQRPLPDAHERLRTPLGGFAQPLGLAAGEHDRVADHCGTASGAGVSAAASLDADGRPTPS